MDFFRHPDIKADIENVSMFVFHRLCYEVGTSLEVGARRDMVDLANTFENQTRQHGDKVRMQSGSRGEGFRFKESDLDIMYWPDKYRVIWELHQSQSYNMQSKKPILCDCSESPPGYTLLYLLSPELCVEMQNTCIIMKNRHYLSSFKHKMMMRSTASQHSFLHGPCVSKVHGSFDYDRAYCFASEIWPPSASSWIDRSQNSWPPPHIVDDIVQTGCHFVAIGHKLGRHEQNEWRISFSLAEQKLVYAMNHPQFLTYALLKLFLNRIINNGLSDDDKLLCSYHMKTAVFWTIQRNNYQWCPHNLLYNSWACFRLILQWVYEGVCPNFFIPSNNMFLSNIHGEAQNFLFDRLYELHEMGIKSMLDTLSIMSCDGCLSFLRDPNLFLCADEEIHLSEADFDVKLCKEIKNKDSLPALNIRSCIIYLHKIEQMLFSHLTKFHVIMLQRFSTSVLQNLAFVLHLNTSTQENKLKYRADKKSCHILKLAAKFGCISDMLYIAMHYHRTLRYREALAIIELVKVKLAKPYVMHNFNVDKKMYEEAVGGQSWSRKMRQAIAWHINLNNRILYISELIPEQLSSKQNDVPILFVPPNVMSHLLEIFCLVHVDIIRANTALDNLRALVHFDQRQHIPGIAKNIAWQILGMCQQRMGYFQDALYSYQQSLREDQLHSIQSATEMRMETICQWIL